MEVLIKPVDVWLFRDGRPFTAGEDHDAVTVFPPTPFTLQGAIRTRVLLNRGKNLADFAVRKEPDQDVGFGDNFGNLRLFGPVVVRRREGNGWERLVPVPADVVKAGDKFSLLKPQDGLPFVTNLPKDLQLLWVRELAEEVRGWLPEREWLRYLQGQPPKKIVYDSNLFTFEPRLGIAVDRSKRTVQKQMLYRATFVRLKDAVALWAKIESISLGQRGFLRFGGEGRGAIYEVLSEGLPDLTNFWPGTVGKRFKVVLLSPAWFSGGLRPRNDNWQVFFGGDVRLVAVAIPHPQKFGGFDVAANRPKPIRNFVPAGSVYFFEAEDGSPTFSDSFAFTETPEDIGKENGGKNAWAHIGLGKALIGIW